MTSGSLTGTASLASNSLLLQGTGSIGFATTASMLEVSSSQQQISSSLLQVSASYISLSGSYTTFSGSASTRITANSSSIQQVSSSQQQISASLLNVVANYATTGSNSFRANQSITGSLVVSSTITAQTLVVQTVTSSIVYSSGSNIFGSSSINTHDFTGSVRLSGSLSLENTYSLYFNGITDSNWRIYRNVTASFTKSLTTGSTLNLNAHYGTGEGFAIGAQGGSSYYEILGSSGTTPTHFFRGSVGIGVTNPSTALHVSGTVAVGANSTAGWGRLYYDSSANNVKLQASKDGTDSIGLSFWTQASGGGFAERMVISGSNVGIGNSTPAATLHLGAVLNGAPASTSIAVPGDTSIRFNGSSDGNSNYGSYIAGTQYGGVRALSLGSRQGAGDVLAMTITQGNVGIGTTNPGSMLEVSGSIVSTTGQFSTTRTVTISALNTSVLIFSGAPSGIISARDNTNGGSGMWLHDPNGGSTLVAQNWVNGVYTVFYSGGNTYVQKTSGNVPVIFHYVIYGN